jgi:GntR family transcriptional regulator
MILQIDTSSSVPVYAQIIDQIKRAIALGTLKHGDNLPSLRETAVELRINPQTVMKAYRELEHQGLIETRQGLGSFVTAGVGVATKEFQHDILEQTIDGLLIDAIHMGLTFEELKHLFQERITDAEHGFAREIFEGEKVESKNDR